MSFYNRKLAVEYAKRWALERNIAYYNYEKIGGDCTNFISQCLYAGKKEMNYRGYGWFYKNANTKSASWTGVEHLYKFLINNNHEGPRGFLVAKHELEIGDIIQLSFDGNIFGHSLIITEITNENIKVCAHTIDSKDRDLNSYMYKKIRFLNIS